MTTDTMPVTTEMGERPYEVLAVVSVSLSSFLSIGPRRHEWEAAEALRHEARRYGADAVVRVLYERGPTTFSWRGLKASGAAVRYTDKA